MTKPPPRSLLDRMTDGPGSPGRAEFERVYAPLLRTWLRSHLPRPADADAVTRDVLAVMVAGRAEFRPTGPAAFRAWLWATLGACLRSHGHPSAGWLEAVATGAVDSHNGPAGEPDADHDRHVVGEVMAGLRPHFPPATWQAFWRTVVSAEPADRVAADMGLPVAAVFIARSRVLGRLRREVVGLVEVA